MVADSCFLNRLSMDSWTWKLAVLAALLAWPADARRPLIKQKTIPSLRGGDSERFFRREFNKKETLGGHDASLSAGGRRLVQAPPAPQACAPGGRGLRVASVHYRSRTNSSLLFCASRVLPGDWLGLSGRHLRRHIHVRVPAAGGARLPQSPAASAPAAAPALSSAAALPPAAADSFGTANPYLTAPTPAPAGSIAATSTLQWRHAPAAQASVPSPPAYASSAPAKCRCSTGESALVCEVGFFAALQAYARCRRRSSCAAV